MEKVLAGKLTISRPQGNRDSYINIEVIDQSSRNRIIGVEIDPARLMECLTGLAYQECTIKYYPQDTIGKVAEHKTEIVPYDRGYSTDEKKIVEAENKALKPFEVDGWIADRHDMRNHHRHIIKGKISYYNVGFTRYV